MVHLWNILFKLLHFVKWSWMPVCLLVLCVVFQRRFLAAFMDIQGISYETEMMERGKIILELRSSPVRNHH